MNNLIAISFTQVSKSKVTVSTIDSKKKISFEDIKSTSLVDLVSRLNEWPMIGEKTRVSFLNFKI